MLIFRLELDKAVLREVSREARATLHANGQDRAGWGNALEKADEELKVAPFADVHVDEQGAILGLLYPPHERIVEAVEYLLKPGGRYVGLMCALSLHHNDDLAGRFKRWLRSYDATVVRLGRAVFRRAARSANVPVARILIDKL